jgi:CheY-like chemotaxis protein
LNPFGFASKIKHMDDIPTRVLVVDDEPAVLKIVNVMLTGAKYSVVTCESGVEALKILSVGQFDCVITDAAMPVLSGYDLVRAIRRHPVYSEIPVLMLTRRRNRMDVKRAVEAGVTDYVLKPIDDHLFLDKVSLCIKKGEGKRHVFELKVDPADSAARMSVDCSILAISETDMTLKLPIGFPLSLNFSMSSPIFKEIGIETPMLKILECEKITESPDERQVSYKARVAFIGMDESALMKVRSWVQRAAIRQRR